MSLIRYLVSIVVHLAMLLVGGFLCFAGTTSLLTVLAITTTLSTRASEEGPSFGELLFETDDMSSLWFADMTPWLMTIGCLAVGLPLVFFGLRGLIRRIRRGLPDQSEGEARSGLGRIAQMLLYIGLIVFGGVGVIFGLIESAGPVKLYLTGERALAEIERTWSSVETEDKTDTGYFVAYLFDVPSGETIPNVSPASAWLARTHEPGSEVEVIYDPADPTLNFLVPLHDVSGLVTFFGFRLLLIVFGIWGLRRSLNLSELIAKPDPQPVSARASDRGDAVSARVARATRHVRRPRRARGQSI